MTEWPKCSVCKNEIIKGEVFVVDKYEPSVRVLTLAHARCVPGTKLKVRRMNDVRSWAVREYSTVRESAIVERQEGVL